MNDLRDLICDMADSNIISVDKCRARALPKNGPSVIETGNNKKMYHDWVVSLFPGVNN